MAANRFKHRSGAIPRVALAPVTVPAQSPPPSGALINVILEYADIQQELGGDRFILRLSAKRMKDPVIKSILGRETKRLADVSVVWDEEEGEIIEVRDDAPRDDTPLWVIDGSSEFDTFELTEAALAYVARHKRRT